MTDEGRSTPNAAGGRWVLTSDKPTVPMHYPGFILRTLCKEGYDADDLLAGTGLTPEQFVDPYFRAHFNVGKRFVLNTLEITADPHIGLRLARKFEAHVMGLPAYTAMNAPSFLDALGVLSRFFSMTFPAMELSFPSGGAGLKPGEAAIRLRPRFPVDEIAYFASCSALIVCHQLLKAILREPIVASRFETYVSEPEDWSTVAAEFDPIPASFGAAENLLIFQDGLLDRPLPGADPINHARFCEMCERFAAEIGHETTVVTQVMGFLDGADNLGAPLAQVAQSLGYSERGLRRKLERTGTTFRQLTDQLRERKARELLAHSARPIHDIAHALGYDTPSNFARSFKRWTGVSPKAFRESSAKGSDPGQS